jgi:hypothetical protein
MMGLMGLDCIVILQLDLMCIKLDYSELIRVDSIETIAAVCQTKLNFVYLAVQIQPLTASDHGKQQIIVMRHRARNTSNNIQCKPTRSAPHHVSIVCKYIREPCSNYYIQKLITARGGSQHVRPTTTSTAKAAFWVSQITTSMTQ